MRVMVTRPEDPHDPLAEQLGRLGAEVIVQPAIRIASPADWRPVDAALARLNEFDWLVFSSANGVRYLLDRLREKGIQLVSEQKLAAIGPGTADELARYGLRAELVPERYRAEALAKVNELKGDIARAKTELENLLVIKWDATRQELSKLQTREGELNIRISQLERQLNILLTGMTDGSGVWVECDPPAPAGK